MLTFLVEGQPQTAGSKVAMTPHGGGRPIVLESGDRKAKSAWREDVRSAAREALGALDGPWDIGAPMEATFVFYRRRPKGHYGTGRNAGVLKATAPRWPTTRPDALKLARAVEDALSQIVWLDDSAIVVEHLRKEWGERDGCLVSVVPLSAPLTLDGMG